LRQLAARLGQLDATRLGRIPGLVVPLEVQPLTDALDAALERLAMAFRRERTLTADLAHELRTPLSGLRTALEVGVDDPEPQARLAMRESLGIVEGMRSLTESLLTLARLEGGQEQVEPRPIGFLSVWEEVLHGFPGLSVRTEGDAALRSLQVVADPRWLSIVLRNLLENASRHTGPEGWIALEAASDERGEFLHTALSNSGCELAPQECERVFDRFWRHDSSRSGSGLHAGLGLSLCRELVTGMGGTLAASCPSTGVFRIDLRLPCPARNRPEAA